jgi:hypothetical protein
VCPVFAGRENRLRKRRRGREIESKRKDSLSWYRAGCPVCAGGENRLRKRRRGREI